MFIFKQVDEVSTGANGRAVRIETLIFQLT